MIFSRSSPRPQPSAGFSLVELIVVVAIFLIVAGVVLFNQNRFSSNVSINNFAYNVALDIRKAQIYGLLVREESAGAGFDSGYGVRFQKDGEGIIYARFFADENNDGEYDGSGESIGIFDFAEGNAVSDVCTTRCLNSASSSIDYVDITFKRPDPDASIKDSLGSGERNNVLITVRSALGDKTKNIIVLNTGQISVE